MLIKIGEIFILMYNERTTTVISVFICLNDQTRRFQFDISVRFHVDCDTTVLPGSSVRSRVDITGFACRWTARIRVEHAF